MGEELTEEVMMEVEAVQAVYGDDCIVLNRFPPHLHVHIKPRTADVHSQQFVEATIEIQASAKYPSDPPCVDIIGSKGLDEKRQKHLSATLREKTRELSCCLMLVALCEEAVETLSSMNHPEGDCPLCLYPLVPEGENSRSLPFMKLMSCFHCFHWIPAGPSWDISDIREMMGGSAGNCPVCRKGFLARDIEHVLSLVDSRGINTDVDEKELSEKLLQCDLEKSRREKFEAILELQQQRGGLIEPPKDNVLFSRLSLQELVQEADLVANGEAIEQQDGNQTPCNEELQPSGSSNQTHEATSQRQTSRNGSIQPAASGSRARFYAGQRRHSAMRKHGRGNSRPHTMQWTRKE
ncbi:hypothetical protein Cgig2_033263 [Carnegiea gigantea]|uniref:RWD domain-containing protein n=1 Tax=Carnegiea gigantea TaxID=171969 RepID=A0A9Q1KWA3_9CARY|nr:hypothetical protein Cgig2_033263 [Carnegiea gigantea]